MIENLAEESKHPYAKETLASLYIFGIEGLIEKDYKKALTILEECKEEPYGARLLGQLYFWDDGYEIDYPKAMEYFNKAYELGDGYSAYLLGHMYQYGKGVSPNIQEAISWYTKAANLRGNTRAMMNLANIYYENDSFKNIQQSLSWLKKAAKFGDGDAYDRIGYFYTLGEGVEKNDSLAFENFKKAAELKSANGALNLGVQYMLGCGTIKDLKESENGILKRQNMEMQKLHGDYMQCIQMEIHFQRMKSRQKSFCKKPSKRNIRRLATL